MMLQSPETKPKLSFFNARLTGLVLFTPAFVVLALAVYLQPDVRGYGTHQQLGLGSCTFMDLTTFPCPLCGMTTTFTYMAHMQFVQALGTQPFGVVLFMLTVVLMLVSLAEIFFPGRVLTRVLKALSRREGLWYFMFLIGMISGWIFKIIQMHNST